MRKNVLVKFIHQEQGIYDPYTSTYEEDKETSIQRYCNVSELTGERSFKEFGEFYSDALVIRTTQTLNFVFNCVEIDGKRYDLLKRKENMCRTSVVVRRGGL